MCDGQSTCSPDLLLPLSDQVLHLWNWEWLLWPDASRVWDPHLTRAQPRQLPVSAASNAEKSDHTLISGGNVFVLMCFSPGSSWCTWLTRMRLNTRGRFVTRTLERSVLWSDSCSAATHSGSTSRQHRKTMRVLTSVGLTSASFQPTWCVA